MSKLPYTPDPEEIWYGTLLRAMPYLFIAHPDAHARLEAMMNSFFRHYLACRSGGGMTIFLKDAEAMRTELDALDAHVWGDDTGSVVSRFKNDQLSIYDRITAVEERLHQLEDERRMPLMGTGLDLGLGTVGIVGTIGDYRPGVRRSVARNVDISARTPKKNSEVGKNSEVNILPGKGKIFKATKERLEEILDHIDEHGEITQRQVRDMLGITQGRAEYLLKLLVQSGEVVPPGRGRKNGPYIHRKAGA